MSQHTVDVRIWQDIKDGGTYITLNPDGLQHLPREDRERLLMMFRAALDLDEDNF